MKTIRFSLTFRVLLLATLMLTGLGGTLLVIALRQQRDLIQEYSLSEIRGKLDSAKRKTEAIRYTVSILMELDRIRDFYTLHEGEDDSGLFFPEERYQTILSSLRTFLASMSGGEIKDADFNRMLLLASRLRRAYDRIEQFNDESQVRGELVRVREDGRALDALLRGQSGYMDSLRTALEGLDQENTRIQTVSLFFEAHFDTSLLEPARDLDFKIRELERALVDPEVREDRKKRGALIDSLDSLRKRRYELSRLGSTEINTLRVGSDQELRATLDPVRFAYYQKKPAISPRLAEYDTRGRHYLISVETLFMKPSISNRAKLVRNALEGQNGAVWARFLEQDRKNIRELKETIAAIATVRKKSEDGFGLSPEERKQVEKLYEVYESLRARREENLRGTIALVQRDEHGFVKLQKELEEAKHSLEESRTRIKEFKERLQLQKQKDSRPMSGETSSPVEGKLLEERAANAGTPVEEGSDQDIELLLDEEINRVKQLTEQVRLLEEQTREFFPESAQTADAFSHLRDALLSDTAFLKYDYDPYDSLAYEGSVTNRSLVQKKWNGLRTWILRSCAETKSCRGISLSYVGSGAELVRPRRVLEATMWELDTTPIDELADRSLFQTTAAFTRIFYDKSELEEGLALARDRLLDTALSLGLRMLFIALLLSLFFVRTIKEIISGAERIGEGNLDVSFRYRGKDELGSLVTSLNRMTRGLKHRERMIEELSTAEQIQRQLLPEATPPSLAGHLVFADLYRPSSGVGGDYFDYIEMKPGKMAFCIADVTGHGPGPAMVMAMMRSHLHSLIHEGYETPEEIIMRLNDRVVQETPPNLFITIFLGIYDMESKDITYCSAGHNHAIVYRFREATVEEFPGGGLPMGLESGELFGASLKRRTLHLNRGDLFFQYTDGLNEARNRAGEQFGLDRVKASLQSLGRKRGERLVEGLALAVQEFSGRQVFTSGPSELDDDIAMIAFRRME